MLCDFIQLFFFECSRLTSTSSSSQTHSTTDRSKSRTLNYATLATIHITTFLIRELSEVTLNILDKIAKFIIDAFAREISGEKSLSNFHYETAGSKQNKDSQIEEFLILFQ